MNIILIKTIYTFHKEDKLYSFYAGLITRYEDDLKSGKYAITLNPEKKEVAIFGDEEKKSIGAKLREKAQKGMLAAAGIKVRDEPLSDEEFARTVEEIRARAAEFEAKTHSEIAAQTA